jgi:hypothetical protein
MVRWLCLGVIALSGCNDGFQGAAPGAGAGGGGGAGGAAPAGFEAALEIQLGQNEVAKGYTARLVLDHQKLVSEEKSLESADDLRVWYQGADGARELERVVEQPNDKQTIVWFALQDDLAEEEIDQRYRLRYGDPDATDPPDDPGEVFAAWEDFDGAADDWTFVGIGSYAGMYASGSGELELSGVANDIWSTADDCIFFAREWTGDFVAESRVNATAGNLDTWARVGGVMARASNDAGSRFHLVGPIQAAVGRTATWRLADGAEADEELDGDAGALPEYAQLRRLGATTVAAWSTDGAQWTALGGERDTQLPGTVQLGIPFSTSTEGRVEPGTVFVDWFRIRALVREEPMVVLGEEVAL